MVPTIYSKIIIILLSFVIQRSNAIVSECWKDGTEAAALRLHRGDGNATKNVRALDVAGFSITLRDMTNSGSADSNNTGNETIKLSPQDVTGLWTNRDYILSIRRLNTSAFPVDQHDVFVRIESLEQQTATSASLVPLLQMKTIDCSEYQNVVALASTNNNSSNENVTDDKYSGVWRMREAGMARLEITIIPSGNFTTWYAFDDFDIMFVDQPLLSVTSSGTKDELQPSAEEEQVEVEQKETIASRQPFKFRNIYMIGGRCDDQDSWYTKFTNGGLKTLNVTKHFCSPYDDGQYEEYGEAFHEQAIRDVRIEAGDFLNETLVVTGRFVGDGAFDIAVDMMKEGMTFFHGLDTSLELDFSKYNLTTKDVRYLHFMPDERDAAEQVGKELCRLKGSSAHLKVAKKYTSDRPDLFYRVDNTLASFQKSCPNTKVTVVWELSQPDGMTSDELFKVVEPLLQFKLLPDVILSVNDDKGAVILDIAEQVLPKEKYDKIFATGWDNSRPIMVKKRKILATVDQMVFHPGQGYWQTVDLLIKSIENNGLKSTADIQEKIELDGLTLKASALVLSSDTIGYLLSTMMDGYDARSSPMSEVNVSTGLYDVSITQFDPFGGKFVAVFWQRWSWYDPRLTWDPFQYNGTVTIESSQIWYPHLYYTNQFMQSILYTAPVVVSNNGRVTLDMNIQAEFLCSTTDELRRYPFDEYRCSIDIGAINGLNLDQSLGFAVISTDSHFVTETSTTTHLHEEEPDEAEAQVSFVLGFSRRPFTAWVRLIIPAILINMVGFMAFWIPEMTEAIALGITSLLCTLAFRETVDMPDTADVTWTEVFMMVNISYQAMVMMILLFSFNATIAHRLQLWQSKLSSYCCCVRRKKSSTDHHKNDEEISKDVPFDWKETGLKTMASSLVSDVHDLEGFEDENQDVSIEANRNESNSSPLRKRRTLANSKSIKSGPVVPTEDFIAGESRRTHVGTKLAGIVSKTSENYDKKEYAARKDPVKVGNAELDMANNEKPWRHAFISAPPFVGGEEVPQDVGNEENTVQSHPPAAASIGRWIVVPSYLVIVTILLVSGAYFI